MSRPSASISTGPSPRTTSEFRADIQALRALAVVSVLLYHLWPNRLTGGFVGVDVFFVISGYLITSHLIRERATTGRIALGKFWARRAARLLPASLLVLLVTAIAVLLWLPRTLWQQFLGEVAASALYVQNWRLLFDSVDYLAAENDPSPVQHFWTLSAEEQFYVLFPLLLVAAMWMLRRLPWRRVAFAAIALVSVTSFLYSVWLLGDAPSHAYFSTFSRAWEFGAGALLAFLPALRSTRVSSAIAFAGVAAVLASVVLYSGTTPFPGAAALLPVVGTALAIWAGSRTWLESVGRVPPIAMLGRVSYAVYLWHWPLIVLVPFMTGTPLTTAQKAGIAAASVGLAWLSTTYYEDVLRTSPRLLKGRRPRTVALWSAAGMVIVLSVSAGAVQMTQALQQREDAQNQEQIEENAECFGAAALLAPAGTCGPADPDLVVPSQFSLLDDNGRGYQCYTVAEATEIDRCSIGSQRDDALRVAIVGNSHAAMIVEALYDELEGLNWRLDTFVGNGCVWGEKDNSPRCRERLSQMDDALLQGEPYDVLLATTKRADTFSQARVDEYTSAWERLEERGTQVVVVTDNPGLSESTADCIATRPLAEVASGSCTFGEDEGYSGPDLMLAAAEQSGHRFDVVDLRDLYCTQGRCPAVIGNVIVYRDTHHLTATYARSLARPLIDRLQQVLESSR
ncbi:acyltransferase family protein [Microbacterium petrolearium]